MWAAAGTRRSTTWRTPGWRGFIGREPNAASLLFKEHEESFRVGAAAAMKSKTGKIGFVGGMKIPLIDKFETG